jgi:hypothetical protein
MRDEGWKEGLVESAGRALREAYERALAEHERARVPVAVWRDGRAIEVAAAELAGKRSRAEEKTPVPR